MMWIISICWFVFENQYFGWNAAPKSDAELIADGIGMILVALAMIGSKLP